MNTMQNETPQKPDVKLTRREYAEGLARLQYPMDYDRNLRALYARLLDRELSVNYHENGDRR
jgi:hypothetical protein